MRRRGVELFHGTDYSVPYVPLRPSVMTLHDLSPWLDPAWQPDASRVRRRTPRLLRMGLATMVITPTEAVRRAAIERFKLAPDRVVAVPLAAGELFRPPPAAAQAARKSVFLVCRDARAAQEHRAADRRVARSAKDGRRRSGAGWPGPRDSPALPEEPGLRVLGEVPDSDLPGLYSGALACVYPSLYEGFGLPVLEAMQCGALVITSRDPAILEVSADAAVHVDAEDTAALVEAMRAVATNSDGFDEVRQRALARAAQFSWQKTARLTREVYDARQRALFLTPEEPKIGSGGGGLRSASLLAYLQNKYDVQTVTFSLRPHSKSPAARVLAQYDPIGPRTSSTVRPFFRIRGSTGGGSAADATPWAWWNTSGARPTPRCCEAAATGWCSICTISRASWRGPTRARRAGRHPGHRNDSRNPTSDWSANGCRSTM